jgi:hypothetical protein
MFACVICCHTTLHLLTTVVWRFVILNRVYRHGVPLSVCAKCPNGGSMLCVHRLQPAWCRQCRGNARCEHGRQKSRCWECGGVAVCIHKRLRYRCKECLRANV